jgi:hypothetical protein
VSSIFGSSFGVFVGVTGILLGFTAALTGQAIADTWRPRWPVVVSAFGLALVARFLDFSLFGGTLLSLPAFLLAWVWLAGVALAAWQVTLAHNMVRQYPWLYEPAGPFRWRQREGGPDIAGTSRQH